MEIDATFTALPLRGLTDAALQRAGDLGCAHADVRIERLKTGSRVLRDGVVEQTGELTDLGLSVRVVHDGAWGFAADVALTPETAVALVDRAVALAKVSRPLCPGGVKLADEPIYPDATWVSAYEINPFDVDEETRLGRLRQISEVIAADARVAHVVAQLGYYQENTFFANLAGTSTTQQRVRIEPKWQGIRVTDDGFYTMDTLAPPAGRGWEYLTGTDWDFDAEAAALPELLAEHAAAPSIEPGRYDLVVEPTQLWLTVHESIAHGTELDRSLGYEAAYAGSSFATFDQLGSLQYGSPLLQVTGDRTTEHGLASVGYDHEGVAAQEFDIIRDGVLVGFQLNRQMAAERELGRSNGCAYADSPGHIPMQRMPNVSVAADPAGPDVDGLIGQVSDGLYVVGDKSWSIDMQRYNFQFTAQRFYRIRDGKLVGQVKDAAYQATTTEFWGSLTAVGGPQTWLLAGATNCGKGQPGQSAPVSHGVPACLFTDVNVLNTQEN